MTVQGWTTWASAPPKDYFAKFLIQGGPRQQVIIDDVLPQVVHQRTHEEQARVTALYVEFISHLASTLGVSVVVEKSSELFSLTDVLALDVPPLSLHTIRRTFPQEKRERSFSQLSTLDLLHPLSEFLAFKYLAERGVGTIIRGAGQQGLVAVYREHYSSSTNFSFVDPEVPTSQYINALEPSQAHNVRSALQTWTAAHLVRGSQHADEYARALTEPFLNVASILDFYKDKKCCLILTGSFMHYYDTSGEEKPNDVDFCVLADTLDVPPGFDEVPKAVRDAFSTGALSMVSLKSTPKNVGELSISIRFVKPVFIASYYSTKHSKGAYWRQDSLVARGMRYEKLTTVSGRSVEKKLNERAFEGGYWYDHFADPGNRRDPIISVLVHMVISGRILKDTVGAFMIKKILLEALVASNTPSQVLTALNSRRTFSPHRHEEVSNLLTIAASKRKS